MLPRGQFAGAQMRLVRHTAAGDLVARYRWEAGLSTVELGRRAAVHPSYISRIELGQRPVIGRDIVLALAGAMGIGQAGRDALLLACGYAPEWLAALDPADATLAAVVRVLTDEAVPSGAKAEFRTVVEAIAGRWAPAAETATATSRARGGTS